jgi:hypothetical protein
MLQILNDLAFLILGACFGMLGLSMMVVAGDADKQQVVGKEKQLTENTRRGKNDSENIHDIIPR